MALLLLLLVAVFTAQAQAQSHEWAKTSEATPGSKTTTLQFYFHDTQSGTNPSAIPITLASNSTHNDLSAFGTLFMADDDLTLGPSATSKLLGRAQGLYGSASKTELAYIMALSFTFLDGPYNGSSVSVMGRNSVKHPVREFPVVGGTGVFRMGRGYAVARTYWVDFQTGDAIVGYNVTIVH